MQMLLSLLVKCVDPVLVQQEIKRQDLELECSLLRSFPLEM